MAPAHIVDKHLYWQTLVGPWQAPRKVFTPKYMTLLCVRALQLAGLRGVINGGFEFRNNEARAVMVRKSTDTAS